VWSCTHTNMRFMTDLPPEEAVTVMTFAIGGHMGELIQDLRAGEDGERFVATLHLQFDEVRRMVKENREPWLLRSAIGAYVETLHEIAERRGDLGAKCDDLESKLEFLADQYARRSGQDQGAAY